MHDSKQVILKEGVLTQSMDIGSDEFNDFRQFILSKSQSQSAEEKRLVNLTGLKYRMEDYLLADDNQLITTGEFLKETLSAAGIRQNKFAEYIGMQPSNLNKVINGERKLSMDLALILGNIFNIGPLIWIGIQNKNELKSISNSKSEAYSKYMLNDLLGD